MRDLQLLIFDRLCLDSWNSLQYTASPSFETNDVSDFENLDPLFQDSPPYDFRFDTDEQNRLFQSIDSENFDMNFNLDIYNNNEESFNNYPIQYYNNSDDDFIENTKKKRKKRLLKKTSRNAANTKQNRSDLSHLSMKVLFECGHMVPLSPTTPHNSICIKNSENTTSGQRTVPTGVITVF